jgi:hypothetical protein
MLYTIYPENLLSRISMPDIEGDPMPEHDDTHRKTVSRLDKLLVLAMLAGSMALCGYIWHDLIGCLCLLGISLILCWIIIKSTEIFVSELDE